MTCFCGIDIGSTAIKIALIDEAETIVAAQVSPTGSHFHKHAQQALENLLGTHGLSRQDLGYIVSTGYGRKLFREADEVISEITANAVGAAKYVQLHDMRLSMVINIGGQDLKIITLDSDGHVKNFVMNDKCAAGTGRFLEMAARNLEMDVEDLGDWHFKCQDFPATINSTCTVFAESEIIGLLAHGSEKSAIVAGIHYSIANRVSRLAKRAGALSEGIFFDGGPAQNKGLVRAVEDKLRQRLIVPNSPQTTTAFGAALIAREASLLENQSA